MNGKWIQDCKYLKRKLQMWTSSFIPHFNDSSSYSDHPHPKEIIILSTFLCHFPNTLRARKLDCIFWNTLRISQRWWNTAFSVKNTKNLVPNTFMRSLPRTKAAAYKHSLKYTLTESWHKSNIEFSQYNIMYCHCHESMCEKRLILYEIAKTNKISTWRSALLNWEQQISYWNLTLILHNHHPQPPDHHRAANFTPPHLHV